MASYLRLEKTEIKKTYTFETDEEIKGWSEYMQKQGYTRISLDWTTHKAIFIKERQNGTKAKD
jgi:hypothetical protein